MRRSRSAVEDEPDPKRIRLTRASAAARASSPALPQQAPAGSASGSFVSAVDPLQRQQHSTTRSAGPEDRVQNKHGSLSSSTSQKVICKVQLWYQGIHFVHLELPGSASVSALKQQLRSYTFGDKRFSYSEMDVWPVGRVPEEAKEQYSNQTKLHDLCDGDSRTVKFCLQSKAAGAPTRLLLSFEEALRRYEASVRPALAAEAVATSPATAAAAERAAAAAPPLRSAAAALPSRSAAATPPSPSAAAAPASASVAPDASDSITLAPAGSHGGPHAQPAARPAPAMQGRPSAAAEAEAAAGARFLRGIAAMEARLQEDSVPRSRRLRCDPIPMPQRGLDRQPPPAAARHNRLPADSAAAASGSAAATPVAGASARPGAGRSADPAQGAAAGAAPLRTTSRTGDAAMARPGRPGHRPPRPQMHNLCDTWYRSSALVGVGGGDGGGGGGGGGDGDVAMPALPGSAASPAGGAQLGRLELQVQRGVIPLGSPGSTRSSRLQFARWQSQETKRLIDGVLMFGKGQWKLIAEKYDLMLRYNSSPTALKDKWANIVKAATLNRVSRSSPLDQADVTRVLSTLASWRAPDT